MDVCVVFTCSSQCVCVNEFKWQSTTPQHPDWALLYTFHSIPIGHYYIHFTTSRRSAHYIHYTTTIYIGHKVSTHPNTLLGARAVSLSHLLTLGLLHNDNSYGGPIHAHDLLQGATSTAWHRDHHSTECTQQPAPARAWQRELTIRRAAGRSGNGAAHSSCCCGSPRTCCAQIRSPCSLKLFKGSKTF